MKRREFLRTATATAVASVIAAKTGEAETKDGIPYRVLGHTGEKLSLVGVGGHHIGRPSVPEAVGIQIIRTALDGRTRQAASQQIDESLRRLQTDHIDLLQIHEIIRINDPERVFAPGGAMEALVAARKAGKIRYIGFTGHKSPQMHLHMLDVAFKHDFTFDSVQMPLNV